MYLLLLVTWFTMPFLTPARLILDALLPPRCVHCGHRVQRQGELCATCWQPLYFLQPPLCVQCGIPLDDAVNTGSAYDDTALCANCLRFPPLYTHARAAVRYDAYSRGMIIPFKHFDRTDYARLFARWLSPLVHQMQHQAGKLELVIPVPLHPLRLWQRRFNQSALLAQWLSASAELPFRPGLLLRVRATQSQGRLSRQNRLRNVAGAFTVPKARTIAVRGRRILLVDDVMTTGATVLACARALKGAGAEAVYVLTVARVL